MNRTVVKRRDAMGMPLVQWDTEVAPILRDIEAQSRWTRIHADRVKSAARFLRVRPDFETTARAELQQAVRDLGAATAALNDAIAMYDACPADE